MKIKRLMAGVMAAILIAIPATGVYASDGEEYVTITVHASDDNEGITYALDSDDPGSFGPSNMFTVPAGTSHTIYVKDAAGNITSQVYEAPGPEPEPEQPATQPPEEVTVGGSLDPGESGGSSPPEPATDPADRGDTGTADVSYGYDGQTIDIDLELKKTGSESERPYEIKKDTPAEQGEGTVYSKTFLDGTDSSEQVFYSMTTEEGNVFYLLVDQGQESNNVYLLNQVNNQDLAALAVDGGSSGTPENSGDDSLLKALSPGGGNDGNSADTSGPAAKGGINGNAVIMLFLMAAGGGFYYYQKVYKAKKEQEMDAMEAADMDQFTAEGEDTEDEEIDFKYGEGDKEQYLRKLIDEEEEEFAAAAESEEADMGWDVENREPDAEEDIPEEDISGGSDGVDIFDDTGLDGEYDPDLDGEEEEE